MRLSSVLAILMLATMPAASLNWDQADPVVALEAPKAARPPAGGVAGQFDTYVFSLQWAAAFCEGKPSLPECSAQAPGRFSARNLTIHGLWPDKNGDASHSYGYCGVDPKVQALDRAPTWCRMPALELTSRTAARVSEIMPGSASCLDKHEWYKHGSCSGFTPDEYYNRTADLVMFVAGTKFGRFLSANTGRTVTADALLEAFESEFGAGTRGLVRLNCTKGGGADLLLDVRLTLSQPLRPAAELGKMLLGGGGKGNCPASFKLDEL